MSSGGVKLEGAKPRHTPSANSDVTLLTSSTPRAHTEPQSVDSRAKSRILVIPVGDSPKHKPQPTQRENETKEPQSGVTLLGKGSSATPRTRDQKEPRPQSGILVIPAGESPKRKHTSTKGTLMIAKNEANVIVIPVLDMKNTRLEILGNWRGYTPQKIVAILREHYQNQRSLAVMLSRIIEERSQRSR